MVRMSKMNNSKEYKLIASVAKHLRDRQCIRYAAKYDQDPFYTPMQTWDEMCREGSEGQYLTVAQDLLSVPNLKELLEDE
jgi:hypothetical protein